MHKVTIYFDNETRHSLFVSKKIISDIQKCFLKEQLYYIIDQDGNTHAINNEKVTHSTIEYIPTNEN